MDAHLDHTPYTSKDLDAESEIRDQVFYSKLTGASKMENFRSPDAYIFIIFERVKGMHSIDFVPYQEKNLQIHISFPGQIHSWESNDSTRGHKLIINKAFIEHFLFDTHLFGNRTNRYPVIDISRKTYDKLFIDLCILQKELSETTDNTDIILLRTQLILRSIDKLVDDQARKDLKRYPQLIQNFCNLLDNHFISERTATFYADKLSISSGHLTKLCKEYLGTTTKEVIDQRVALEARRLLLSTNLSIKEITYRLAFTNMARFSSFLKSKTGLNPKQLRNRYFE